ncbi:MAG: hypothetical protein K2K94_06440 [Muribaculaceae bacterium]|nr:hypothetical protein [Muribaculaceae bacterium]
MKKLYTTLLATVIAGSFVAVSAQSGVEYTMGNYTINPASGSTVKSIETITVTFNGLADGIDAHILTSNVGNYISITDGTDVYKPIEFYAGTGKAKIDDLVIVFPKIAKAGTYTLDIAEGVVMDYDQAESHDEGEGYSINGPITATYTIAETVMNVYTVTPASGSTVSSITDINIKFPKAAASDGVDQYSYASDNVTLTGNGQVYKPAIVIAGADYDEVRLHFDEAITEPGQYVLTVKEGVFKEYGSYEDESVNPEIVATYTIEGTTGLQIIGVEEDQTVTVVDVLGRVVLQNADKSAVESLENGLYIVNGKKVAIGK